MGGEVRFAVLGPLAAGKGEETLDLGGRIQQKVLALLLASPNSVVSDDRLVDEVWDGDPPASAYHLIQVYVSRLRGILDGRSDSMLLREGKGYRLQAPPSSIDAVRFAGEVQEGRRLLADDPAGASRLLEEALAKWRGPPFGDLADEVPSLRVEATRLEELRGQALEDRVEANLAGGRHAELVAEIEQLTHMYPYRQRLWGHLMLALYRSGREVEALRTYQSVRELLGRELGVEPSADLREMEERILLQDPDLAPEPLPAPFHVPAPISSFVGRGLEVGTVAKLLESERLVTLVGPGGIGKTRLAYEVADRLRLRFPDGVWSLDVTVVEEAERFLTELAGALGVIGQAGTDLADSIADALARREMLIVCDNCEHVAEEVAGRLGRLLTEAPRLRVLATSRVPLRVPGEVRWTVPAMSLPDDASGEPGELLLADAIRLFCERAASARSDFSLGDGNAAGVVEICRRMEGVPLAIEMAASRITVLSPAQIAEMVGKELGSLGTADRGVPARQRTLRAAFDWSYRLLQPEERRVLNRLGVFAGPFDLVAAERVAVEPKEQASAIGVLGELVDASLVAATQGDGVAMRYRLLESVKEFALAYLGAEDETSVTFDRHAAHFIDMLAAAAAKVSTPDFSQWLDLIEDAYADVRRALDHSLDRQPRAETLRAAPTLREFWYRTARAPDAVHWSQRMLEGAEDAPGALRAAALDALAFGLTIAGDLAGAEAAVNEAEQLMRAAKDRAALVGVLFTKSQIALATGDPATMMAAAAEALRICDEIGDQWRRAQPQTVFAFGELFGTGNLEEARRLFEEVAPIYRELGDVTSEVLMALGPLTTLSLRQGDLEAAEQYGIAAVAAGGHGWQAAALACLGEVYTAKGDHEVAGNLLGRALLKALDAGLENWFRIAARNLAQLAAARSDFHTAALLHGASLRNMPQFGMEPAVYGPLEEAARGALGDTTFDALSSRGANLSNQQILDTALGTSQDVPNGSR